MTTTAARRRTRRAIPDDLPTLIRAGAAMTVDELRRLATNDPAYFEAIERANTRWMLQDAQANALEYYRPVDPDAMRLHLSTAREFGIQGGNKSGKTGTIFAEAAIQMTGVVPFVLRVCATCGQAMERRGETWVHERENPAHDAILRYPVQKLRAPIRVRLVVTSQVDAWGENLKNKLQWFEWNGRLNDARLPGDPDCGHYGWIPQRFLINGDWQQSWADRARKLTLNLRGDGGAVHGSTLSVMSHKQDMTEFNQGSYSLILEDEIPPEEVHRANRIRTLEVDGMVITGGTPPDEREGAVAVGWYYDKILRPGLEGVNGDEVDAVALWTERNRTLNTAAVEAIGKDLSPEERRARFHGESLHLAGVIIRGFTEKPRAWCARCFGEALLGLDACPSCGGRDLVPFAHVWDDEDLAWPGPADWPTLFYMDPHQAKPTAALWIRVDPNDAGWVVAEKEIEGDAQLVKDTCEAFERAHGLHPMRRVGDPKISAQTNQFARTFQGETFSIKRAFEEVGFHYDDANTNFTVGIERLERALKVSPLTRAPGLRIHRACRKTIYQVGRFSWDKDKPGKANSDFPAALRYFAIEDVSYRGLKAVSMGRTVSVGARRGGRNSATGW